VVSPSGRQAHLPLPTDGDHAGVVARVGLDAALLDLLPAAGVDVRQGATLEELAISADGVKVRCAGDVTIEAHTVIVATGASAKLLGLPNESKLMGRGVSTCATCDGFFFKDQNIMVVGGGDSALEEALYLSRLGRKVDLVHRREALRGSKIMQERAFKNPKITFLWNTVVEDVLDPAAGKVTTVKLRNIKTGALSDAPVDGLFVAIGHQPNTALVKGQVDLHPNEYIKVVPGTTQTSVPGVFAAGDVQDFTYRQAVTAAGTGCMAALEAERYLEAQGVGD